MAIQRDPPRIVQPVAPGYACQVFPAEALVVRIGANLGDPLGDLDELCLGDIYHLLPGAEPLRLMIAPTAPQAAGDARRQPIAEGSAVGRPGGTVELCARLTLMAPEGDTVELLVLRPDGPAGKIFALPLSPMAPRVDYTLIRAEADPGTVRLSDLVCISFGRGTMIALADGRQVAIETLRAGSRVLTRDHGPQPVRWIGRATLRALGSYAPVVITTGTLGNSGDLIVGQHHRMFLYQRDGARLAETAELLVQAKHLVDGERVFLRQGGYMDYFSLIFDRHEIIYAEGIPAESLMVNDATLSHLPEDLAAEVKARFPDLSQRQHFGTEAGRRALDGLGAARLFRPVRAG
jgi:hypothetical protein